MIKVALVDDNQDLREGLQIMMKEHHDEFECVGSFADAESAAKKITAPKVLQDLDLAIKQLKESKQNNLKRKSLDELLNEK